MTYIGKPHSESPPDTAPNSIAVKFSGFDTEEHGCEFANLVATYVRALSRFIDLSALDGITVAFDYANELLLLDRGYVSKHKLTPSEDIVLGVAMTPAVIRDGKIKSHMLFHAGFLLPLENEHDPLYS